MDKFEVNHVQCMNCHAHRGSRSWPNYNRSFELAVKVTENMGDYAEATLEAGGVFCSVSCVIDWLQGE